MTNFKAGILAATFMAAAVAAGAQDHHMRLDPNEKFALATDKAGAACTRDSNTISYETTFFVSTVDLQSKGINSTEAFVQAYGDDIAGRMNTIWREATAAYSLSELQTDQKKLAEFSNRLNAGQQQAFDKFEEQTGITVRTSTAAAGIASGCKP